MSIGLSGGRGGVRGEWRNTRETRARGVFIKVKLRGAAGSTRGRMLWFIQCRRGGGNADKVCSALSTSFRVIYSRAGRRLCLGGSL